MIVFLLMLISHFFKNSYSPIDDIFIAVLDGKGSVIVGYWLLLLAVVE